MAMEDMPPEGVVLAATDRALPLRVEPAPDERIPDGMVCLASYLGDRLIARCAVPQEAADKLNAQGFFNDPVRLMLAAREEPPGLQCRLFAIVDLPEEQDGDEDNDEESREEPWASSVPGAGYEAHIGGGVDADGPTHALVFLGQIVRFDKDRKHPDNLAMEAADVLRRVVEGQAVEVVDKLLDDLLP
ncbi:MAG: hypothetical protein ABI647_07370 [Gemmatimonadota bacterium]